MSPAGREPVATGAVEAGVTETASEADETTVEGEAAAGVEVGRTAAEVDTGTDNEGGAVEDGATTADVGATLSDADMTVLGTAALALSEGEAATDGELVIAGMEPPDPDTDPDGR